MIDLSEARPWVAVDIETTGLNREHDLPCEIGFAVVNPVSLETEERITMLLNRDEQFVRLHEADDDFVLKMHRKSGLMDEMEQKPGYTIWEAEARLLGWLEDLDFDTDPKNAYQPMLLGSSLAFDRGFLDWHMGALSDSFFYRMIDVSSLKELAKFYRPELADACPKPIKRHRVMPDIDDTLAELRYYRDTFLQTEPRISPW